MQTKSPKTKPVGLRMLRTGFLGRSGPKADTPDLLGSAVELRIEGSSTPAKIVSALPEEPENGQVYILLNDADFERVSLHNLVRFPAKLHPPLAKWAVRALVPPDGRVLDPFCGCGTVLLEAQLAGRQAIGFDVDPYSAAMAAVKCAPPKQADLQRSVDAITKGLASTRKPKSFYTRLERGDISSKTFVKTIATLCPEIPNAFHWFKRYVLRDLAEIWSLLKLQSNPPAVERLLKISFASILRLCSNADPDTLSGLEVTRRMIELSERGRKIDAYEIFRQRLHRNLRIVDTHHERYPSALPRVLIRHASAIANESYRRIEPVDAVITSPPYCSAVEYDRRHQLEHYWLGYLRRREEAVALRMRYVGRRVFLKTPNDELLALLHEKVQETIRSAVPRELEGDPRFRPVLNYFVQMKKWLGQCAAYIKPGGVLALVVGDSTVRGHRIPTSTCLAQMAPPDLVLEKRFAYVLRNRSMQYSRWNHANVAMENVLVFRRAKA